MVKTFFLATVAAGLAAASVASVVRYTPQCRAEGERCIGAPGKMAVEWIPCCDGYECSAEDTSYGGYGKLCAPKPVDKYPAYPTEPPAPKCRAEGDRCKGAPGKPAVEWIPCCDGYECSAEDTSYGGYGTLCAPKPEMKYPAYPTEPPAPKCRAEGDRCKGAPGKPAVDWIPCCEGYECSAEDTSYGGYGTLCAPVKKYYTEAPKTTTAAPVYTTAAPKCVKEGKECDSYGPACCKDLECVASGKYDYTKSCEPVKVYTTEPPTTTTTAPKCAKVGEKCGAYEPCCDYAECKKDDYGYASTCVATY